jgi:hypothetical protein
MAVTRPCSPPGLTRLGVAHRYAQGARIVTHRVGTTAGTLPDRHDLLLLVRPDGRLVPADGRAAPSPQPGDTAVMLGPPLANATSVDPRYGR